MLLEMLVADWSLGDIVCYSPFQLLINPIRSLQQQKPVIMKGQLRYFNLPSLTHGLVGMESDRALKYVGKICNLMGCIYCFRLALCWLLLRYMTTCLLSCFDPQP